MSSPIPITIQELQSYDCSACGSEAGKPCMTYATYGQSHVTQPHQARWDAVHAGRARRLSGFAEGVKGDPVVAGIVKKLYGPGEPDQPEVADFRREYARKVHFIYDARRDQTAHGGVLQLWCSCHAYFGPDKAKAERHLLTENSIPSWVAQIVLDMNSAVDQKVIDAMLANDEDPTDIALYVRYRDWVRHALAEAWLDRNP